MTVPVAAGDIVAGRYRIERVLGQGGMGVVVAARHIHLGEAVAIKFPLARAMLGRDMGARVVREGRAAAKLRGEHVARVMDVGTLDSGEPFIVFELLRGSDLETALETRGPLPIGEALEYVLQACEALAEAHALGIVHRDLKPANLFLTRRPDGSPSIKIIDFGIAKAADGGTEGAPAATESFMIFGTPLYMSPEQMRSSKDVDARSDLWSLGAVLHHLLAGTPPFPPKSLPEIYQLAQAGAPRIRGLRPEVPAAIEAALLRCMAPSPADRFADVAELAEAIAPEAPPRARVSAERARRILASDEHTLDGADGGDAPGAGDLGAAPRGAPGVARDTAEPGSTDPAPAGAMAVTLEAGRPAGPAVPAAAPTSAAARSGESEAAQSTIAAVKIDVTTGDPPPRRRPVALAIAVLIAVACAAAAAVWLLGRTGSTGAAAQATSGEPARSPAGAGAGSAPQGSTAAVDPVPSSASAAAPGPAVVTPSTATLPVTTSAAPTSAPASATMRPRTPGHGTIAAPAATPRAGPLDDPN